MLATAAVLHAASVLGCRRHNAALSEAVALSCVKMQLHVQHVYGHGQHCGTGKLNAAGAGSQSWPRQRLPHPLKRWVCQRTHV